MRLRLPSSTTDASYPRRLLRAALLLGGVQGLRLVLLLMRNKALAVWLGPSGLGVLSQINGIADTASLLCTAGLGAAIARFIAADVSLHSPTTPLQAGESDTVAELEPGADSPLEAANAEDAARVGALLMGVGAVLGAALLIVFRAPLARGAAGSGAYAGLLALVALTIPLNAIYQWSAALLQGAARVRGQAAQSTVHAVLWLGCAAALVAPFGLRGGVWGILAAWAGAAVASVWLLYRNGLGRFVSAQRIVFDQSRRTLAVRMLQFGGVALVSALSPLLTVVGTRAAIIHWGGEVAAGYYQVPVSMSNLSFQPLTLALSGFVLPHLYRYCRGAHTDWPRLHAELQSTLLLIVGALTPVVMLLLLARHTLTHLLFSTRFLPAAVMIPPQLAADYFHALAWWLALPLLPLHRYRAALAADLSALLLSVAAAWLLLPVWGLAGAPLGSLCAQIIVVFGLFALRMRSDGLHLQRRTVALVGACSLLIALTTWRAMHTA